MQRQYSYVEEDKCNIENQKDFPSMKLENGNVVKVGTVATILHCIDMYNKGDRSTSIIDKINESIPILINARPFSLLTSNE